MATYIKRGTKVQAKVRMQGIELSKTFASKTEARKWATEQENDINAGKNIGLPDKTFGQLLEKYKEGMDPLAKRQDILRINRIVREEDIAKVNVRDLDSTHVATWRDARLKKVKAASVLREWNLMSPACKVAITDWKWLKTNPFSGTKRPEEPEARSRRVTDREIELIKHVSGYDNRANTLTARVGAAFLFAIETGMRVGEICAMKPQDVHLKERYVEVIAKEVGARKTRNAKRQVSLSAEAERLLREVDCDFKLGTTRKIDPLWRDKIVAKAAIKNLHFHDSRHEAITRLARKLDVLDLARMVGIGDLKTLLAVYYNPTATEISARLNS